MALNDRRFNVGCKLFRYMVFRHITWLKVALYFYMLVGGFYFGKIFLPEYIFGSDSKTNNRKTNQKNKKTKPKKQSKKKNIYKTYMFKGIKELVIYEKRLKKNCLYRRLWLQLQS